MNTVFLIERACLTKNKKHRICNNNSHKRYSSLIQGGIIVDYVKAFLVGGILCAIGQIFIDKTALTPAKLLTGYVCSGVFLSLFGLYGKIVDFAGAGATVPLTGFGYTLFEGVKKAIEKDGFLGVFTGGLTAASGGITAAVVFALVAALISKPKTK